MRWHDDDEHLDDLDAFAEVDRLLAARDRLDEHTARMTLYGSQQRERHGNVIPLGACRSLRQHTDLLTNAASPGDTGEAA